MKFTDRPDTDIECQSYQHKEISNVSEQKAIVPHNNNYF